MASEAAVIREARLDDAPALAQLAGELGYAVSADEAALRLGWHLASRAGKVFVAVVDDEVVVTAPQRRRGVARQLLAAVERWAAASGFRLIRVRSRDERGEAHAAYASCGYGLEKEQLVFSRRLG